MAKDDICNDYTYVCGGGLKKDKFIKENGLIKKDVIKDIGYDVLLDMIKSRLIEVDYLKGEVVDDVDRRLDILVKLMLPGFMELVRCYYECNGGNRDEAIKKALLYIK